MTDSTKWVFAFDEGDGKNKKLLGGKGANLCEMTQIGLNVPPGFVITTEACLAYLDTTSRDLPEGVMEQVRDQMAALEQKTGKGFRRPGEAVAGVGALGVGDVHAGHDGHHPQPRAQQRDPAGLDRATGNERFGYDAYRRFIQLFGKVALGVSDEVFDKEFDEVKKAAQPNRTLTFPPPI